MGLCESLCPRRLAPYDDFNAAHIDPDKWFGVEPEGPGTEAIRQLQDQRLSLVYRSYGKTDSDRETLWHAQRNGGPPDQAKYLECLRRKPVR